MATLVYKRTHPFDPDAGGIFGIQDCMGRIRKRAFENVIGIGGVGAEAQSHRIDGKVNWIGLGARIIGEHNRGPLVAFDHFLLMEENGPLLRGAYRALAKRFLHATAPRSVLYGFNKAELGEIEQILALAKNCPPSTEDLTLSRKSHGKSVCRTRRIC